MKNETNMARIEGRDRKRGYSINVKMLCLAYATEIVIATASLIGAALFARTYGHNDPWTITMMMLAPVGYAVVEVCRVPLAVAVRTQASLLLRLTALAGVICAAGVTVKSMSQLGEVMFRPRLTDVARARETFDHAKSVGTALERRISDADTLVTQRSAELGSAERQVALATEKLGGLPEQRCSPVSGFTRNGQPYRSVRCSSDPRIATLTGSISSAKADRDLALQALNNARAERAPLSRAATEQQLDAGQLAYREAVLNSQLHSFTAMVFGKSPTEVTDEQIHQFLRIFVFLPAICTALAATLVALTSVHAIKPESITTLDDNGVDYILGPFAREVIQAATDATMAAVRASINHPRPTLVPEKVA